MKTSIVSTIVLAVALLAPQISQAQGTVYLSNLSQTPITNRPVGSDSWLAESFATGTNAGGYLLNSVQLAMTNASGNPSGFTLMLYSAILNGELFPGNSLATLSGVENPATNGIYTYLPSSDIALSPGTAYYLVLTAGTTVADGAYNWNLAFPNYNQPGGWHASVGVTGPDNYTSLNGVNWIPTGISPQFAISGMAIPEPDILSLFALGSLSFLWQRRKAKALL